MRLEVVVENTSDNPNIKAEHGLSLFINADNKNFFFDFGQSDLFLQNAKILNINIKQVEFAIISHGHYDHGGGIEYFSKENPNAPIFLNKNAFKNCYSKKEFGLKYIGLKENLKENKQIKLIDNEYFISNNLIIFSNVTQRHFFAPSNLKLFEKKGEIFINDNFDHEQNLIIRQEGKNILLAGCAHSGIINIINKAEKIINQKITDIIGGLHLMGITDQKFLGEFAQELKNTNCNFYTCHCTSLENYSFLKTILNEKISYIKSGEKLEII